jgi:predicted dehydrogenase
MVRDDKVSLTLEFADGSVATIHYLANGDKGFPKERIEIFTAGRVLQLDNFLKLRGWGWKSFSKFNLGRQEKGQRACTAKFVDNITMGRPQCPSVEELIEVSRVTIEAAQQVRS